MITASSQGASLSYRYLQFLVASGLAVLLISGCKKEKEPAIIEEVPAAAPPAETDTSATLAEEPDLQQVGKDQPGSAKSTFHPSGKGGMTPSADQAGFSESGRFVVQVAVFKSKRQAASLVEKLSGEGYPAYVAEVEDPAPGLSGTYHRVRIGKFLKIADARAFGENTLKPLGYDFWVDNKKNDAVGAGAGDGYSEPAAESVPAPSARKAAPVEPSEPPSGTWNTPAAESAPASGDSWSGQSGAPAASEPSTPAPAEPSNSAAGKTVDPASSSELPPANPAPAADTGKVNLDDW